jgi:hypothetical protein
MNDPVGSSTSFTITDFHLEARAGDRATTHRCTVPRHWRRAKAWLCRELTV